MTGEDLQRAYEMVVIGENLPTSGGWLEQDGTHWQFLHDPVSKTTEWWCNGLESGPPTVNPFTEVLICPPTNR